MKPKSVVEPEPQIQGTPITATKGQNRSRHGRKLTEQNVKGQIIKKRSSHLSEEGLTYEEQIAKKVYLAKNLKVKYVLYPHSKVRQYWDVMTSLAVIYVTAVVPYQLAFYWDEETTPLKVFSILIDIWFWFDMLLNFRTGFVHNGVLHMEPSEIAEHYFYSWFFVDFIGVFPFESFAFLFTEEGTKVTQKAGRKAVKMFKYFKLPKLLRVSRMLKVLVGFQRYYGIISGILVYFFSAHLFSCLWMAVLDPCQNILDSDVLSPHQCNGIYVNTMYWKSTYTISGLMTGTASLEAWNDFVGSQYHDLYDTSYATGLYLYGLTINLFGFMITAFILGHIYHLITNFIGSSWQFRHKMDNMKSEMSYYNVPRELQEKVMQYYEYLWIHRKHFGDSSLMKDEHMSPMLKRELSLHLFKELLVKVPFFEGEDEEFLGRVCMSMETEIYMPNEYVVREGEIGRELFIVNKGECQVHKIIESSRMQVERGSHETIGKICQGDFFGEISLIKNIPRTASISAFTMCELNVLSREFFEILVNDYPEFGAKITRLANSRLQHDKEKMTRSSHEIADTMKKEGSFRGSGSRKFSGLPTILSEADQVDSEDESDTATSGPENKTTKSTGQNAIEKRSSLIERKESSNLYRYRQLAKRRSVFNVDLQTLARNVSFSGNPMNLGGSAGGRRRNSAGNSTNLAIEAMFLRLERRLGETEKIVKNMSQLVTERLDQDGRDAKQE